MQADNSTNAANPREIEIKLRCDSHGFIIERLRALKATDLGPMRELNEFFDTADHSLRARRMALRVRRIEHTTDGRRECLITVKGSTEPGDIQNRPSIDLSATPPDLASMLLMRLGYQRTAAFEKLRHSWMLGTVRVELDTVPIFGLFIELEGPAEDAIIAARTTLGLNGLTVERTSYHAMLLDYLAKTPEAKGILRFGN